MYFTVSIKTELGIFDIIFSSNCPFYRERLAEELLELVLLELYGEEVPEGVEQLAGAHHLLLPLAQLGQRVEQVARRATE